MPGFDADSPIHDDHQIRNISAMQQNRTESTLFLSHKVREKSGLDGMVLIRRSAGGLII